MNLKAFSKKLVTWISWSFQKEEDLEIHNPCITCETRSVDRINEKLTVLFKGKKYEIILREKDIPWFEKSSASEGGFSKEISNDLEEGSHLISTAFNNGIEAFSKEFEKSPSLDKKSNI